MKVTYSKTFSKIILQDFVTRKITHALTIILWVKFVCREVLLTLKMTFSMFEGHDFFR